MPYDFANSSQVATISDANSVVNTHLLFGWDGAASGPQMTTPGAIIDVAVAAAANAANSALSNAVANLISGASGSFTPGLSFDGVTTGITYGAATGSYVIHGNVMFYQLHLALTSKGSATGSAIITGLPSNTVDDFGIGQAIAFSDFADLTSSPFFTTNGDTTLNIKQANSTQTAPVTDVNLTDTSEIYVVGFHRTAT